MSTEATYDLEQVATEHLPKRWKPDYRLRWLRERLNRGELRGVRFGRYDWRMRDSDVAYMLKRHSNEAQLQERAQPAAASEPTTVAGGLSERSRRTLRSA